MPAEFENGFFGSNQPAWHGAGIVIPEDVVSYDRVIELVPELAMEIRQCPLWAQLDELGEQGVKLEAHFANVRSDGQVVGVVGDRYRITQPREGFQFLDDLLSSREAKVNAAITLRGGSVIAINCIAPQTVRIAGLEGEEHQGYVNFVDSYDGSTPLTALVGMTRMVCMNTVNMGLAHAKARYQFRHTESIHSRLPEVRHALGIAQRYWDEVEKLGTSWVAQPFSDRQFMATLDSLVPLPSLSRADYDAETHKRIEANAERERDALKLIWIDSPSNQNIRHTAWAAFQTWTEWLDHHTKSRETARSNQAENRFKRIMFDTSLRERAYEEVSKQLVAAN